MAGKSYFFYGHRKPSQNRPIVHGGLFSNRQTLKAPKPTDPRNQSQPSDLSKWDPHLVQTLAQPDPKPYPRPQSFLSPIARFIIDAFRKNDSKWGPEIAAELQKLRRVTPSHVAEVLKVQTDPSLASKFFHWASKQKGFRHDYGSYNAFTYCLNRANRFRSADQVIDLMEAQGKPPSEKQFEILIRMHSDANRGLRVYYVYEKMKKFGIKPRVFLFNRVMDGLVKTGHFDLALSVYGDFREAGLVEESVTFMILIKGLCKNGRFDEMFELLSKMRANLCRPDVFAYTAMIKVIVKEGFLDSAIRVWDLMRKDNVGPDVVAYSTMIDGLCKAQRVEEGFGYFKEMRERRILIDRRIYATLIEAFVEIGRVGSACDLFTDMVGSGYRPDLDIYTSLVRGLCDVNRVDKARQLLRAAAHDGLEPGFESSNPVLLRYAESQRMEEFRDLVSSMKREESHNLWKFFEFMVEKDERVELALRVFKDLKFYRVEIYNVMMDSLRRIGMVEKSLSLFDEMKTKLEPNSASVNIAIECFVKNDRIEEACECHNKIIQSGFVPSNLAYLALARGLCQAGAIGEAMALVRDCLGSVESGPLEFKCAIAIVHACRRSDGAVEAVIEEMIDEGCLLDEVACSALVYGMCEHGTVEEARKVFERLRERGFFTEAKVIMYEEVLVDFMKKRAADLVVSGIRFFGLESKLRAKGCNLLSK